MYLYNYMYTQVYSANPNTEMFADVYTDIHTASIRFQSRFLTAVSAGALLPQFQGKERCDGIETCDIREGTWA